jgi:hypothetical protein
MSNIFDLYNQTKGQSSPSYYAEGQYQDASGNRVPVSNNPGAALGMLQSATGASGGGDGSGGGGSNGAFQMGQALGGALGTNDSGSSGGGGMGGMMSIVSAFL